jgi:HK97 family phage prohead protease
MLWQHRSSQPIGHVTEATVSKDGISVVAHIVKGVDAEIDKAWKYITSKLVRGLSIGFRSLESEPLNPKDPWGATRFKSWEWMELSAVTIPANAEASIHTIKQFDTGAPALTGLQSVGGVPPGLSGKSQPVKPERKKPMNANVSIAEQISAFEAERAAKAARIVAIVGEADGATLDEAQKEEYDTLSSELGARSSGSTKGPPSRSATNCPSR